MHAVLLTQVQKGRQRFARIILREMARVGTIRGLRTGTPDTRTTPHSILPALAETCWSGGSLLLHLPGLFLS